MSKFKERLWRDLMREHRSELAQIDRPAAGRARYARPRLLAGTTVGFAVIATAIVLFLSAASTPAAFAVSGNSDGTVSVVLRRFAGIRGANQRLAALGIRAKVVAVAAGCRAALPPAALANIKTPDQVLIHAGRQTRIDPRRIPPGRMVVIMTWVKAGNLRTVKLGAAAKAAPDCIAGPAPQALRFAWAVAHGCHIGEVKARPNVAIARRPGGAWTVTRKPGGGVTIDMGPGPQQERRTHRQQRAVHREQRRTHRQQRAVHREQRRTRRQQRAVHGEQRPGRRQQRRPGPPSRVRSRSGWPRGARSRPGSRSRPEPATAARRATAVTPGRPATAATAARRPPRRPPPSSALGWLWDLTPTSWGKLPTANPSRRPARRELRRPSTARWLTVAGPAGLRCAHERIKRDGVGNGRDRLSRWLVRGVVARAGVRRPDDGARSGA